MNFLALIAFVLTLIATYFLASHRYVWDAFFLLGWATLAMSLVLYRTLSPLSLHQHNPSLKRFLPRTWIGWGRAGAVALCLWVAYIARSKPQTEDFTFLFIVWGCALLVFVLTLLLPWLRTKPRLKISHRDLIALTLLLVVAFLLRSVALSRIPANLGGDEGTQLLAASQLLDYPLGNPFATGWYSVPTMSFFMYGAAMRVFGASIAGGRMLSALVGTLTILGTFLLAHEMGGRKAAWIAAVVMTGSAYHIHFSRLASNQIMDPLIGTLSLWLLWRALRLAPLSRPAQSRVCWGGVGFVAGWGWYAYFGARWTTLLIALVVAWRFLFARDLLKIHWRGLLICVLAWALVTLPLWGWYSRHPSPLTERYNAVNVFNSGWMAREMARSGKNVAQLLLQQFWASITAFHFTPDPTFWYFPQRPLLDFVTGALVLTGIVATFIQWRQLSHSTTLLCFGTTLIMAWTLTENPPSSQRGLLLMPMIALLVAWGILALERVFSKWRADFHITVIAMLFVSIILNLTFYFRMYTPRRMYGNYTAETATKLAHFISAHPFPPSSKVDCHLHLLPSELAAQCSPLYLMGAPELYWDFGTLAFLLRDQPGLNILPDQDVPVVKFPTRFVFTPLRDADRLQIQAQYPMGTLYQLTATDGRPLAFIYDVP